jgi:hypothetical protein
VETTPPTARRDLTARFINDPRDRPFLALMAAISVTVPPFGMAFYVPGVFRWWLGLVYLTFIPVFFLDRFILMLHNTSHRPLFKKPWAWMNNYIPWVLGPFFGQTPETYFAHHIGMHHPENNLEADLSTTMPFTSSATTSASWRSGYLSSPATSAPTTAARFAPACSSARSGGSWR